MDATQKQELVRRGALPRDDFQPCTGCEARSMCSAARHCTNASPATGAATSRSGLTKEHLRIIARLLPLAQGRQDIGTGSQLAALKLAVEAALEAS